MMQPEETSTLRSFATAGIAFLATMAVAVGPASTTPVIAAQQAATQAPPTEDYQVGARDVLEIRVFGLDDLNQSVRVSEAGTISLPLIGDLQAAGLTRASLESALELALSRYVTDPQVSVFIREYQSQRFIMMGAVSRPGTYEMVGPKTLLEALSDAGGVNAQEATGEVTILRAQAVTAPVKVDLRELLEEGNLAYNVRIEPGDTVNVLTKESFSVYVVGQVRSPGAFTLRENVTLLQAISMAGGFATRAAKKKVRIVRIAPDGSQEITEVNVEEIMDGEKPDIAIRPSDVIVVPETFF